MRFALIPLTILFLASGCAQPADHAPPGASIEKPECPLVAEPQEGTINTEFGEYNVSQGDGHSGGSYSLGDFEWDWPSGNLIAMNVTAKWDAGATGEKVMQLRVVDRDDVFHPYASTYGPSPIMVNVTMRVPNEAKLAITMEPHAETAGMPMGVAVNKEAFETHVTMVQTLLCEEASE